MGMVTDKILNRTVRVALVETRSAVIESVKLVTHRLGFTSLEIFANHEHLLALLAEDPFAVDWVLTPLHEHAKINSMIFLERLAQQEALNHVRVSFFLTRKQTQCLPKAFELGLLSFHDAEFSNKHLSREIRGFLDRLFAEQEGEAFIAAGYFREYLQEFKMWEELINLEQSLWNRFHDHQDLALNLADAFFRAGNKSQGRIIINQAQFFDPSIADRAAQMQALYLGNSADGDGTFAGKHSIENAVIIDHDHEVLALMKEVLWKIGVTQISTFVNGEEAWEYMQANPEPHLIIQEWQLPALTGPYFIQRVRAHGFRNVPIIILNSQIQRSDIQLLKEMGASQILRKPISAKQLTMAIAWTIQQYREPTEIKAVERKMIQSLQNGEVASARSLRDRFVKMEDVPLSRVHYINGIFAYHNKRFEDALTHLIDAVRESDGDNVDIIALLSRVLMKLGDYKASLALMEKATSLSPQNLNRLCELAEIKLETGLVSEAGNLIEKAKAQDAGNAQVLQTETKHSLVEGNVEKAKLLMEQIAAVEDVVAFMNNMAVGKTRVGEKAEGIQLYKKTLQSIPKGRSELSAIVNYNLGLALIKSGEGRLGAVYVKRAVDEGDSAVYDRALSLHDRIQEAIRDGKPIKLAERNEADIGLMAVEGSLKWDSTVRLRLLGENRSSEVHSLRGIYTVRNMTAYTEYLLNRRSQMKAS